VGSPNIVGSPGRVQFSRCGESRYCWESIQCVSLSSMEFSQYWVSNIVGAYLLREVYAEWSLVSMGSQDIVGSLFSVGSLGSVEFSQCGESR
jgi:hypothetical protein